MEKVCEISAEEVAATVLSNEDPQAVVAKDKVQECTSLDDAPAAVSVQVEPEEGAPAKVAPEFPLWKLVVAAIPWIGIQALWSTEFAVTTPYMHALGMSEAMSTDIWIFGPITGFITAPVVGALSDSCQSRFGRRRPFILGALAVLWVASLSFASSGHLFSPPFAKWFALVMFLVLDVVVNVVQTPVRAIVSDMASQEQQMHGQIISVLFQGFGNLLGFGIMKIWAVPFESIFQLMVLVLSVLTLFIAIQMLVCHEVPYVRPADAPVQSLTSPFANAFQAVRYMPADLRKIAFVQFFSWYSLFCYWPTLSTWFSVNVFGGAADAPADSMLRHKYEDGQVANTTAGLMNSALMIVFSSCLIFLMLKSTIPLRYIYAGCLYAGACSLILAKIAVYHSVTWAMAIVTLIAVPVSAINAFPFALVGAMNKAAAEEGKEPDTGVQMGVLNIFICTPQLLSTLVVGSMREKLSVSALPWVFFMAGISFAVAGTGAFFLNDKHVGRAAMSSAAAGGGGH